MIKLIIFDLDGTVIDSFLDWPEIKRDLNINSGHILKEIYSEDGSVVNREKLRKLEEYERQNTLLTKPKTGVQEFLSYLRDKKIKTSLITNNNAKNTAYLLKKYQLNFNQVITREMGLWKPAPGAFFHAMNSFSCSPDQTAVIGDSAYDVEASIQANISKIFIIRSEKIDENTMPNLTIFNDYFDLIDIIEKESGMN
jgi:HAD superfamily hydrolase (TIGR01549 family)